MSDSVEKNRRIVIAELFHAGCKASEIIRDTGYAPRTVYRIVSNLRDGKGILKKAHSPRNDKIRTKRFFSGLKGRLLQFHHNQWHRWQRNGMSPK